jgi:4-amino-4-deoxy-L-arabinose transferase-like glycosyltransferase
MTEPPRFRALDLALLLLVLAAAAGVRVWYWQACAHGGSGPVRVQDGSVPLGPSRLVAEALAAQGAAPGVPMGAAAQQIAAVGAMQPTQGENTPPAAPGYPWLLSLARQAPDPDLVVRGVQVALGALTAVFYFLFARRAFRSLLVATLAGLFCALHPFWVIAAVELESGALAAFLLGLAVWLGARIGQSGGALPSLLYGLTLAALGLVRAELLPFAFVAVVWLLWRCRTLPRGWLYALLAFLGFANAIIPWAVNNYRTTGEAVPVEAAWRHLWVGNHPDATGGPGEAPRDSTRLAEAVIDEVRHNPAATVNRRLWAGLAFVFGEEWLRSREAWQASDAVGDLPSWLASSYPAILLGALMGMLLLGFVGWRWTYGWRRESLPAALAVIWVPLPYLLSHAERLSGPRLPLDGVLLCYAAFALAGLLPRLGKRLRDGSADNRDAE